MAISIAFIALMVSFLTLLSQRQHNRKQLLPVVHIYFSNSMKDGLVTRQLVFCNDGLGVAQLKKFELTLVTGEVFDIKHFSELYNLILSQNKLCTNLSVSLPFCLRANSSETIYSYVLPENDKDNILDCKIKLTSDSIYGDRVISTEKEFCNIPNGYDKFFALFSSKTF